MAAPTWPGGAIAAPTWPGGVIATPTWPGGVSHSGKKRSRRSLVRTTVANRSLLAVPACEEGAYLDLLRRDELLRALVGEDEGEDVLRTRAARSEYAQ